MKLNDEAWITLCIMVGFTLILATISGMFYTNMSLYQKTYDKSMECRTTFKDASPQEVNRYCGEIPKLEDFVK